MCHQSSCYVLWVCLQVLEQCEEGVLKLEGDIEVTLRTLEGDEEATFLESAKQSITARRAKGNQRGGKRGGRGGGRGGRGVLL